MEKSNQEKKTNWENLDLIKQYSTYEEQFDTNQKVRSHIYNEDYKKAIMQHRAKKLALKGNAGKIAALQDTLFNAGAYGNVEYQTAINGTLDNATKAAIAKMTKAGYEYDPNTYTLKKKAKLIEKPQERQGKTVAREQMSKGIEKTGDSLSKGFKLEAATGTLAGLWDYMKGAAHESTGPVYDWVLKRAYDNAYPYSYGDKILNPTTGEVEAYVGQEIPNGWVLKQTSAYDNPVMQAKSGFGKIIQALKRKDPRRATMEELASIDLSTSEGRKKWNRIVANAPSGMIRIHGNPVNQQFEMRARLDQMNAFLDRPQIYDTYEINSDYESPTAKARGASTYTIKDSNQRARINGEMANYFLANAPKVTWYNKANLTEEQLQDGQHQFVYTEDANGKRTYIMPMMSYMGNQALIADDIKGTNLRYGDWWDYTINPSDAKRFYTGDRLTDVDQTPKRNGYGMGHNVRHMTESSADLASQVAKIGLQEMKEYLSNVKEQIKNANFKLIRKQS